MPRHTRPRTERPSLDAVIAAMRRRKYRIYDTPEVDWNLNIVGIRTPVAAPERFDDWLVVFHRFLGSWDAAWYPITTDPSLHYLRHPIHPEGTAVLREGQYRGAYAIDIHRRGRKGAHKALCQRLGDVTVFRDADRDGTLTLHPDTLATGRFGINIHRGPRGGVLDPRNLRYSAGCQVFADDRHFEEFMLKCEHARRAFGNRFTYTLLNARDVA